MREVNLPMLELPPDELVRAFTRLLVRSDLEPPPPPDGPPPPWMSTRPAGISAFIRALADSDVPIDRLHDLWDDVVKEVATTLWPRM